MVERPPATNKYKNKEKSMTYSSALSMSHGHYAARNQNVVSFSVKKRRLGPISNTIILIVLACTLGMLYLTQETKANAYGYQINDLQQKQAALQAENDNLQLGAARARALDRVQHSQVASTLVPVSPSGTAR
jgi:hypothetical protein